MTKSKLIFGLSQEILVTVITWNSELNCTCRVKRIIFYFIEIFLRYPNYVRFDVEKIFKSVERWWRSWIVRYLIWFYEIHHIDWKKKTRMDIHDPDENWQENKRPQGPTNYGQRCGNIYLEHQNVNSNKSEPSRIQGSIMLGKITWFIFHGSWRRGGIEGNHEECSKKKKNQMLAAMPCATSVCRGSRRICRANEASD